MKWHLPVVAFALSLSIPLACSASRDDSPSGGKLNGSDSSVGDTDNTGFEVGGSDALFDIISDGKFAPMRIVPSDATLMLVDGKPSTLDYTLQLLNSDGTESDITAEAAFSLLDASLGSFAGNKLTVTKEGKTMVRASARSLTVETPVTVSGPVTVITPGAAADAPTKFGGTVDATRAPSFVYPSDGTIVPPNMNVLEFHFNPGSGNKLFELAFKGAAIDVKVYMSCTAVGAGCVYSPDAKVWKLIAENSRGGDPVTYTLRGVDPAAPSKIGVSAAQKISFGQEDILGGIYYWNAGAGATMRYEFGVGGTKGEVFLNAPMAGAGTCVGCHVLSRNGKKISVGLDIPAPAPYKVFDVATRALIYQQGSTFGGGANFFTFSPDATQIVTSNAITLVLRNATTGAAITDPLASPGAQPDWSPDGSKIVYAKPATTPPCFGGFCGATGVDSASLELLKITSGKWGPYKSLVPFAGKNNFYPAFSPDGSLVAFNQSASNQNSYDSKDAKVFVVGGEGGTPIVLGKASTGGDSWPKWTPVVQKYKGGQLLWITFSSRRQYGLRLEDGKTAQIWMTAIDLTKAKAGVDPSYPAFWLPFQDVASGNHIAQWVTKVERKPCSAATECLTGEQCVSGVCRPVIK